MKPTDYIEWDNLKNIPFFLCQVVEDKENKDIDIYYLGKRVFHDYDHVGHYMRSAIILFRNQEPHGRLGKPSEPLDAAQLYS